ncbi:hypothetical protein NDU88_003732 [Pleurodeles waltl]|uniref:Uncharacterized protein n=1 Tax=Pleurodeles waltl TaxID=8319 RepID=A0AAV7PJ11_PLEWA|nr:hypothetical protein NDU88_003732 [Pleurodeles waltl]
MRGRESKRCPLPRSPVILASPSSTGHLWSQPVLGYSSGIEPAAPDRIPGRTPARRQVGSSWVAALFVTLGPLRFQSCPRMQSGDRTTLFRHTRALPTTQEPSGCLWLTGWGAEWEGRGAPLLPCSPVVPASLSSTGHPRSRLVPWVQLRNRSRSFRQDARPQSRLVAGWQVLGLSDDDAWDKGRISSCPAPGSRALSGSHSFGAASSLVAITDLQHAELL